MTATTDERVATLEAGQNELRSDIHEITRDIRSIRDQLAGRPTWAVTTIITLLTGACAALTTALVTVSTL
jgi:hypothetical protein